MLILVRIIGIGMMIMGTLFTLKPEILKKILTFLIQKKRTIFITGVFRITLGVILLLGANQCRISTFVSIIGMIMFAAGILILMLSRKKLQNIVDWWNNQKIAITQSITIAVAVIGILIAFSA